MESGADGRKGGLIEFENEKLDPYQVLDVPKDANAMQIKAAFRKLALKLHPDKHEGADDLEKEQIAKQFRRVRIAHSVLSDPAERNRLDEEGYLAKTPGAEPAVKPFHEYYSINTPEGYTRGGDFVSTRRCDRDPRAPAIERHACRQWRSRMAQAAHGRVGRLAQAERAKSEARPHTRAHGT